MSSPISRLEAVDQTVVHPVGLAALGLVSLMLLGAPRRLAVLPFLILLCAVPATQRVAIVGMDFNFVRLLTLVAWARVLMRSEWRGFMWRPIDTVYAAWTIVGVLTYTALHGVGGGLVYSLGQAFDALGIYFFARCAIRTWDDIRGLAIGIAVIAIPMVVVFLVEKSTARNLFAVLGGVPAETHIRQGKLRCQGAFPHPILAGAFWVAQLPLMGAVWWQSPMLKQLAVVSCGATLVIIFTTTSSTPLAGVGAVCLGAGMVYWRHSLSQIRWGIVGMAVVLQLVKTKPIWHSFVYFDLVGGSTGWHRYNLIDQTIKRIPEWFVMGTKSTAHWGHNLSDVTNHFVLEAVRGGILRVALFTTIVVMTFRAMGPIWRAVEHDKRRLALAWALGVAAFAHLCMFQAVSYFAQVTAIWYLAMAAIVSMEVWTIRELQRRRTLAGKRAALARRREAELAKATA